MPRRRKRKGQRRPRRRRIHWLVDPESVRRFRKRRRAGLKAWREYQKRIKARKERKPPARKPAKARKFKPPPIRKTRAKWQRRYAVKPREARAAGIAYSMSDEQWTRFTGLEQVRIIKVTETEAALVDDGGQVVVTFPAYRGMEREWREMLELAQGRPTPELVKRWGLDRVKGFKVEEVDAGQRLIHTSKVIYASRRGAPIGQKPGLKGGSKYLGKLFQRIHPQNWVDGIWRSLPAYMRKRGARGFWGMRLKYKDREGKVSTHQTELKGIEDIRDYRAWIAMLADLVNDLGSVLGLGRSGISGQIRVVEVELLLGVDQ